MASGLQLSRPGETFEMDLPDGRGRRLRADDTDDDDMIASFAAKGYVNLGQVLRGEELARCVRGFDGAFAAAHRRCWPAAG